MALVTIGDVTKEYPNGTTYLEIAEEYQPQYEDDILLVRINGKLHKRFVITSATGRHRQDGQQ